MTKQSALEFRIHGMDCAEEVAVLRRELGPLVGGEARLSFDILRGKMVVARTASASASDVMRAVARTGMQAEIWTEQARLSPAERTGLWARYGRTASTAASAIFTAAGFITHVSIAGGLNAALGTEGLGEAHDVPRLAQALYATGIIAGAWYVAPKAVLAARRLRPDMNLLMTIAVIGAALIREWFEAAIVSFLFALSLALESWSVGRARRAVEALLDLAPPTVRVLKNGKETEIPAEAVEIGTMFLVKPGDRIPLDGEVVRGSSGVNQAPITGESVPVFKELGAQVFAGTINGSGAMEVRSTRLAGDTTLANIIRMVGAAQAKRSPSEQWVERFARYYTPIVFATAIAVFAVPPLLFGAEWDRWTYRALVLLVIGCPCALVISTPVSIVAALASAARNGVLIKGAIHVETPAHIQALAMDKTGTLTEGKPKVVDVLPLASTSREELLAVAAAMETQSDHPLARAIVEYASASGVALPPVNDFIAVHGKGATATVAGRRLWLGSHRYVEEMHEESPEVHRQMEELSDAGHSVIAIGDDRLVLGLITLADSVRSESARAIAALRELGVKPIVMLTGDNSSTAKAIAAATGVDEVRAELLPEDKVRAVEELVSSHARVAMIGDGVNDAPAMARATLGIAMGSVGSDAAIETADVALMSDDLSKLPWLVRHSRRALGIIRQNIAASLLVKAAFVALTFAGMASLWAAIAADMGVSLLVIFNALRLLRGKEDRLTVYAT